MSELLLYTLSSVGTMGLDAYNLCFSSLSKCNNPDYDAFNIKNIRNQTLRILSALAHCESNFDRRYISICPSALISLPKSGLPRAVMSGARTDFLVKKMQKIVSQHQNEICIEITNQHLSANLSSQFGGPAFPLPNVIIIEAVSNEILFTFIKELNHGIFIPTSPVPGFLNHSVDLNEVRSTLVFSHTAEPDWIKWEFNPITLKFDRKVSVESKRKLVSYVRPIDQQRSHFIWIDGKGSEIDRDWGRWLLLTEYNKDVLIFDKRLQLLAVPATVQLPILLARAAVLCSGRSPITIKEERGIADIPPNHPINLYRSVPLFIAEKIAKKLNQHLQFRRLEIHRFGE
jgi:hypothetical protein